ncbi:cysteine--tRNA ligase [Candidatus Micrarchaeota archaeon]|nr:cysteine--tRNA ligase [Candidatus Micrarchaeota archaeon]
MFIYNSLTKKIEALESKDIIMYVCGLTPYDSAHIGHARTYVAFDIIKRYLGFNGSKIYSIQNITDVDDKIIKRCKETGADPKELTETVHSEALDLFDKLRIERANDISKFKSYGKLSGQSMGEIVSGTRKEVDESKEDPADFALWKKTSGEIVEFSSPWGSGRPGWHIECSAMGLKYSKNKTIDIHGGGRDLIFPHHENEIAQSEASGVTPFARIWMHTGPLTVNGEKMSKSLGNFVTIAEVLSKFEPNAIRMFFALTHYRSPIDYNEEAIKAAGEGVERIFNTVGLITELESKKGKVKTKKDTLFRKEVQEAVGKFYNFMSNDFDTSDALAEVFSIVRFTNSNANKETPDLEELKVVKVELTKILEIFGLEEKKNDLENKKKELIRVTAEFGIKESKNTEKIVQKIIELRENARKEKNYAVSDKIRSKLGEIGLEIQDTKDGARIRIKK